MALGGLGGIFFENAGGGGEHIPSLDDISGLVAFWDGHVYEGSGDWANQMATPADGSAQSAYDVTPSNTTLWDGINHWTMNNSSNFALAANTTFIKSMHKTQSGTSWTAIFKVKTPSASGQLDTLFATAESNTNYGIVIRVDSGGSLKLDQYDGTTKVTKSASGTLAANTLYNLAVSYDYATNKYAFAVNAAVWTEGTAGFTGSVTADPTYTLKLASSGNGGAKMENGAVLYAAMLIDHKLTDTELGTAISVLDYIFTPLDAVVPDAPVGLIAQGGDGVAYLAWDLQDDGGATVTDYKIEYKASSSGTWLEFSHAATAALYATVTGLTNGTAYDFRVSATNIEGYGAVSSTKSATPIAAAADPYDEQYYKVTLPVNSSYQRTGSALEITQPDLLTYNSAYFAHYDYGGDGNGEFIFNCPDGGATTATATYSRSEFRHLTDIAYNVATEDTIDFAVTAIPDGHKTVVHQIHDAEEPWVKITYTGKDDGTGYIRALTKETEGAADTTTYLKTGITNGDRTKLRIKYTGTALEFYLDANVAGGTPDYSVPITRTGVNGDYYWKRGNYYQSSARLGNICTVVHYAISGAYVP